MILGWYECSRIRLTFEITMRGTPRALIPAIMRVCLVWTPQIGLKFPWLSRARRTRAQMNRMPDIGGSSATLKGDCSADGRERCFTDFLPTEGRSRSRDSWSKKGGEQLRKPIRSASQVNRGDDAAPVGTGCKQATGIWRSAIHSFFWGLL